MTCEVQPLLDAIAAAVPGPPMAAFEAVSRACKHSHNPVSYEDLCHTRPIFNIVFSTSSEECRQYDGPIVIERGQHHHRPATPKLVKCKDC